MEARAAGPGVRRCPAGSVLGERYRAGSGQEGAGVGNGEALDQAGEAPESRRHPRLRRWVAGGAILVGLILLAVYAPRLWYLWNHVSTDDAFVAADTIVPIVPQVGGRVTRVLVRENQRVAAGDLLVEIEDRDYRARLDRAEAVAAQRNAALTQAQLLLKRTRPLVDSGAATPERLDEVEAAEHEASAELDQARAAAELARIDLSRTKIAAPVTGYVAHKNVAEGQVVSPGDALFAVVDLRSIWVMANFKETQIGDMQALQPVDIEVDAYPGHVLRGHVESFQPGTGSVFSLLPAENASGNFVKVVQRVPVRIAIDSPSDPERPLYPGLSVTPYVDTRAPARPAP